MNLGVPFAIERRLLQGAIAVGCLVPLLAGGAGVVVGPGMLHAVPDVAPADLDSHFRYLSGLLLGIGAAFLSCIPGVERKRGRFRLLTLIVVAGGLGRLAALLDRGAPRAEHLFGLAMELAVVPALAIWQTRIAGGKERGR